MSSWGICFANKPQAIELGYKKISKARIGLSRIEIALMSICCADTKIQIKNKNISFA